jgi:tetratricopeptide (TPR) repeat protein
MKLVIGIRSVKRLLLGKISFDAEYFIRSGDLSQAIQELLKIILILQSPTTAIYSQLARCSFVINRNSSDTDHYITKVLGSRTNDYRILQLIAIKALMENKPQEALLSLNQALEISPTNSSLHYSLARFNQQLGYYKNYENAINYACSMAREIPIVLLEENCWIAWNKNNYQLFMDNLMKLILRDPNHYVGSVFKKIIEYERDLSWFHNRELQRTGIVNLFETPKESKRFKKYCYQLILYELWQYDTPTEAINATNFSFDTPIILSHENISRNKPVVV